MIIMNKIIIIIIIMSKQNTEICSRSSLFTYLETLQNTDQNEYKIVMKRMTKLCDKYKKSKFNDKMKIYMNEAFKIFKNNINLTEKTESRCKNIIDDYISYKSKLYDDGDGNGSYNCITFYNKNDESDSDSGSDSGSDSDSGSGSEFDSGSGSGSGSDSEFNITDYENSKYVNANRYKSNKRIITFCPYRMSDEETKGLNYSYECYYEWDEFIHEYEKSKSIVKDVLDFVFGYTAYKILYA